MIKRIPITHEFIEKHLISRIENPAETLKRITNLFNQHIENYEFTYNQGDTVMNLLTHTTENDS